MEIAMAAVSSLLSKLDELLRGEYELQREARKDMEFLSNELMEMQAGISCVSEMREDPLLPDILRSLRDLSYDAEDIIDSFIISVGRKPGEEQRGVRRFMEKCASLLAMLKNRREMDLQIRKIKITATELKDRCSRYNKTDRVAPLMVSESMVDPRPPAMFKEESDLVGMELSRDELINLLLMKDEESKSELRLKIVPIVGFGGLGKTTLAKQVYNTTKQHFQCSAWVTVSQNPNIEKILMDILRQVEDRHSSGSKGDGERDLISRTDKSLKGKRYLIVLDDLWSIGPLEIIKAALPLNNFGSRVIVTTRKDSVAEACCSYWYGQIYNILPLSSEESWMLFNKRIFGGKHCPPDLVDVAEKIITKCSGMPLALCSVSTLLACKPPSRHEWEKLLTSISPTSGGLDVMKEVLLLSYYDLPHHLRVCLLYLSVFPEDYPIKCDRIVWCWTSEGFVLGNSVTTPEEVGQSYLTELINRNLIQPIYGSYDGKLEAVRIPDMVLDLIRCMSIKENFVTILNELLYPERVLDGNFRRLSIINTNEVNYIPESVAKSPVRSLFIFGGTGQNISFKPFTVLRVLDLEGCKELMNHNIVEITNLLHLKFLNIRDTPITGLPHQIGQLPLLETLDLRGTGVQELPKSIVQLSKLGHLRCNKMRFPEGIGKMAALSCLSQIDILQSKLSVLKELGNLSELRKLELWWYLNRESNNTEAYENIAISLNRLNKLQSLCIHGDDCSVDLFDHLHHPLKQLQSIKLNNRCYLNRIPNSFTLLAKLEYACIDIKELKNEDLQFLSELCSLLHLSLSSGAMPTEKLVIGGNGFPVLREFHLHSPRADLTFEPEAMQKVDKLVVSSYLPAQICGVEHLRCLKIIYIRTPQMSQEATNFGIRKAASEHPNHPIVHTIELRDSVDYAAEEGRFEQNLEAIKDYEANEGNEVEQTPEFLKAMIAS